MRRRGWLRRRRLRRRRRAVAGIVILETPLGVLGVLTSVCGMFALFSPSLLMEVFVGLPAFKPGEKVEIDFGMDDL